MNWITVRAVKVGLVVSAVAAIVALASSGAHALLLDRIVTLANSRSVPRAGDT